ncbi:SEC-C domain-containing protein [Myxococcota bacterium]|nr:SEC-C domain-containing protein [Myxococcota bacterium]
MEGDPRLASPNSRETDSNCDDPKCCPPQRPIVRTKAKVGRNEPCPFGSGRKHKKCCG